MPDISMCPGFIEEGESLVWCSIRESCHRFTAKADPVHQTYFLPLSVGEDCEYYWPVKREPKPQTPQTEGGT